jgi:hypothetical protein
MGLKPPDWMCVPLTAVEHNNLHAMGEDAYWRLNKVDPLEVITMNLLVYLAQQKPSMDVLEALGRIVQT